MGSPAGALWRNGHIAAVAWACYAAGSGQRVGDLQGRVRKTRGHGRRQKANIRLWLAGKRNSEHFIHRRDGDDL
jgi:hypothetical protein